jgi:lipopolysaccharide export system protein LptC
MIGRILGKVGVLRAVDAATDTRRLGPLRSMIERLHKLPDRYSRRVAMMKVMLPAVGIGLLLLVTIWPRVAPLFDRLRFAAIDLKEARELRMINPRYAGTDRSGHPFVVTAAVGRQVPARDDVMALDDVKADLQSHSGAKITVTADSAVYQTQTQYLDMFGHVTVVHENGTTIVTSSARLDVANNAAEGHDSVEGHGPSGDLSAQGFQIIDKGDVVIFTGQSNLLLRSAKTNTLPPSAPMPTPIPQATGRRIETKVTPAAPAAHPSPHSAAPPGPPPVARHAGTTPTKPTPAAKKPG